ncbi:deoxynucleoside kinase [Pseudomaricurvus alkylphenolicus]|uniref:deoxynucleoside kinase n=1 Tax=Pseudomaricurvus alkylphenolicus TaxID=1306991 RepID=UPI001420D65E|nr:deoxynucleoside kinase [Pseudomaricurvus alkylphenolicus]NIB42897.1 deoxynucleoside kinase [Pseudomaricurvus alkylphenolicus]
MSDGFALSLNTQGLDLPQFIAVEGPIGAGKTTLARNLAQTLNVGLLEENAEANPFLERFYRNPRAAALPTQLFFLFQRSQQLQDLRQQDLFQQSLVADYLMDKDQLFAQITLDEDEHKIYQQVYDSLNIEAPLPDLVIYLQAPSDVLQERVAARGLEAERHMTRDYLDNLNNAYMEFFHFYNRAPLLIVNAAELDLAHNIDHYRHLVEYMLTIKSGRHYYNPTPTL